jgi:hypothetical protein
MMEGVNSSMIYCKNFCKYHNVPLVQQLKIKDTEKKRIEKSKKKILGLWIYSQLLCTVK